MDGTEQALFGYLLGSGLAIMITIPVLRFFRASEPEKEETTTFHSEEEALPELRGISVLEWDRRVAELFSNNYPGYPSQSSNENLGIPGITDGNRSSSDDAYLAPAIDINEKNAYMRREKH